MGDALMPGLRPTAVEIVRPHKRVRDWAAMLLGDWLVTVPTVSAVSMLLLGACHAEIDSRIPALGFVQTLLGLYTLRLIVQFSTAWDNFKLWTREGKR